METEVVIEISTAAKLLWDEFKYRHELFWNSLFRWGTVVITVSVVPCVKPELVSQLKYLVLVFPGLASILSAFTAWHLLAEYSRIMKVSSRYKDILGSYAPGQIAASDLRFSRLWKARIGVTVPI